MRIISKFHDYYDIGMGQGHDDSLVYVRETKEIIPHQKRVREIKYNRQDGVSYHYRVFGFCGKMIPMVELMVTKTEQGKQDYETLFAYSAEELIKVNEENGFSTDLKRKGWGRKYSDTDLGRAVSFLKNAPDAFKSKEELFQEHKTPIFYMPSQSKGYFDSSNYVSTALIVNPCLKDYEFYKAVDPYTAYQEIDMYIGGVLGSLGADMAEVSDEHRYKGHGYDKESFRQPAGRKKPRRKGN